MPYNINCIKMIFKKITNIEIIPAFNGQDAVEIIQNDQNDKNLNENQKIKLVIMDINMPGMDGIQATHLIKK
jgi:CheY-like chemotaxis protein